MGVFSELGPEMTPKGVAPKGVVVQTLRKWKVIEPDALYSMLRNIASGPEIGSPGRILDGVLPGKDRIRPSGRPKAGRRAEFCVFPVAVRPKSSPEGRFPARKHYCVK